MTLSEPAPLGVVWECSRAACGFRFVAAPCRGAPAATRACPRCGAPATLQERIAFSLPRERVGAPPMPALAVLLDNLRSAYNVGAAFRTADAAGVSHLYLSGITPTPDHRGVAKTALGAQSALPWSHHPNGLRLTAALQRAGWAVWALETAPAARPFADLLATPLPPRVLLVVGNEVAGVDPAILRQADAIAALPMWGVKASLNVGAALAAALYLLRVRR